MYMPLNIDIKKCVVFGGERDEGLQKTEKMAVFADDLLVVPENQDAPDEIVLEAGPLERVPESLSLDETRRIRLADEPATPENVGQFIEGATFVTSDLEDRKINEAIYDYSQRNNILCNIIDVTDLCNTWFMSVIDKPNMLAGLSSKGGCAFYAQRTRIELDEDFDDRSEISRIFTRIRNELREDQCNFCTLAIVYKDDELQNLLEGKQWEEAYETGLELSRDVPDNYHVKDHTVPDPE